MFDKLILVSQGKLIYMGPMNQAIPYFESLGFPSTNSNPANFFIDLTTIHFTTDEEMRKSEQHVQALADSFVKFRTTGGLLTSTVVSSGTSASASVVDSRAPSVVQSFSKSNIDIDITQNAADLVLYEPPATNSWFKEFWVLLRRDWALAVRNTSMLYGLAAMGITTIIFLGFVFFQLKHDQASVQNRVG
ncbi:hypothetical protein GGI05_005978, partial [Coemansia sp. RSA 2603]